MADRRISIRDRVQILDQLDATMWWLNKLSGWLASHDIESEADLLDQAAKDIATASWLLSRPIRAKLPPEAWRQPATEPGQQFQ
jgi:hypothetical protein